jgi:hypothetical protein
MWAEIQHIWQWRSTALHTIEFGMARYTGDFINHQYGKPLSASIAVQDMRPSSPAKLVNMAISVIVLVFDLCFFVLF